MKDNRLYRNNTGETDMPQRPVSNFQRAVFNDLSTEGKENVQRQYPHVQAVPNRTDRAHDCAALGPRTRAGDGCRLCVSGVRPSFARNQARTAASSRRVTAIEQIHVALMSILGSRTHRVRWLW